MTIKSDQRSDLLWNPGGRHAEVRPEVNGSLGLTILVRPWPNLKVRPRSNQGQTSADLGQTFLRTYATPDKIFAWGKALPELQAHILLFFVKAFMLDRVSWSFVVTGELHKETGSERKSSLPHWPGKNPLSSDFTSNHRHPRRPQNGVNAYQAVHKFVECQKRLNYVF
jgi:hypothetical protein